jgi:hypothetical protein
LIAVAATSLFALAPSSARALPLIFNTNLHQSDRSGTPFTTADLARAVTGVAPGAALRFVVPWDGVQPYCVGMFSRRVYNVPPVNNRADCRAPGPYLWNWNSMQSDLDSIATYLRLGRIRLLPVIAEAPSWAWGVGDTAAPTASSPVFMPPGGDPVALAWWQRFVSSLVAHLESRYGAASLAGLEVWNEEDDYGVFWDLEPHNLNTMATRYSQILCAAYRGTRAIDPALPVVFGGLNPADGDYLRAAYDSSAANIRGCMTAIGIHPYNNREGHWASPSAAGWPFTRGPASIAQLACSRSDCGRPLWITEFGYPVRGTLTAQTQGDWDAQAYVDARGLANVRAMGINSVFDFPGDRFGVCARPGSPRVAATELERAVSGNRRARAGC